MDGAKGESGAAGAKVRSGEAAVLIFFGLFVYSLHFLCLLSGRDWLCWRKRCPWTDGEQQSNTGASPDIVFYVIIDLFPLSPRALVVFPVRGAVLEPPELQ